MLSFGSPRFTRHQVQARGRTSVLSKPKYTYVTLCKPKTHTRPKAIGGFDWDIINFEAYLLGKGIVTFTMIYCSMNWFMYRQEQKQNENKDDCDGENKDNE